MPAKRAIFSNTNVYLEKSLSTLSLEPVEPDAVVSNECLTKCELIVALTVERVIPIVTSRIRELVLQVPESYVTVLLPFLPIDLWVKFITCSCHIVVARCIVAVGAQRELKIWHTVIIVPFAFALMQ